MTFSHCVIRYFAKKKKTFMLNNSIQFCVGVWMFDDHQRDFGAWLGPPIHHYGTLDYSAHFQSSNQGQRENKRSSTHVLHSPSLEFVCGPHTWSTESRRRKSDFISFCLPWNLKLWLRMLLTIFPSRWNWKPCLFSCNSWVWYTVWC